MSISVRYEFWKGVPYGCPEISCASEIEVTLDNYYKAYKLQGWRFLKIRTWIVKQFARLELAWHEYKCARSSMD